MSLEDRRLRDEVDLLRAELCELRGELVRLRLRVSELESESFAIVGSPAPASSRDIAQAGTCDYPSRRSSSSTPTAPVATSPPLSAELSVGIRSLSDCLSGRTYSLPCEREVFGVASRQDLRISPVAL